tara:strand:- start:1722 stop:2045 length:324 start_codon:yes stop_codon:yes gene_type:complete
MKNNKLIAEFMGMTYGDPNDNSIMTQTTPQGNEIVPIESMDYHSSWDWLMPVIDKISGIKNWSINATLDWLSESEFNIQQESDGFYTIEDVYLAVVEFIKLTNLKQQ